MITLTLTRQEATELYIALNTTEAGLSPKNAVAAADNLNLLHPAVSALDKGKNAYQRAVKKTSRDLRYKILSGVEAEEKLDGLVDEIEAQQLATVELSLHPLILSEEEIASAKLTPGNLAVLRRRLASG